MSSIKELLHQQCASYVQAKIDNAQEGIDEAQKASQQETKSSAGDKYETGRAMIQQEINRNTGLITEAKLLMGTLNQISTAGTAPVADIGSLVVTNKGKFYIAISAGTLKADGDNYFAVSPASPIGVKLRGKKTGDKIEVNGVTYQVKEVM